MYRSRQFSSTRNLKAKKRKNAAPIFGPTAQTCSLWSSLRLSSTSAGEEKWLHAQNSSLDLVFTFGVSCADNFSQSFQTFLLCACTFGHVVPVHRLGRRIWTDTRSTRGLSCRKADSKNMWSEIQFQSLSFWNLAEALCNFANIATSSERFDHSVRWETKSPSQ